MYKLKDMSSYKKQLQNLWNTMHETVFEDAIKNNLPKMNIHYFSSCIEWAMYAVDTYQKIGDMPNSNDANLCMHWARQVIGVVKTLDDTIRGILKFFNKAGHEYKITTKPFFFKNTIERCDVSEELFGENPTNHDVFLRLRTIFAEHPTSINLKKAKSELAYYASWAFSRIYSEYNSQLRVYLHRHGTEKKNENISIDLFVSEVEEYAFSLLESIVEVDKIAAILIDKYIKDKKSIPMSPYRKNTIGYTGLLNDIRLRFDDNCYGVAYEQEIENCISMLNIRHLVDKKYLQNYKDLEYFLKNDHYKFMRKLIRTVSLESMREVKFKNKNVFTLSTYEQLGEPQRYNAEKTLSYLNYPSDWYLYEYTTYIDTVEQALNICIPKNISLDSVKYLLYFYSWVIRTTFPKIND